MRKKEIIELCIDYFEYEGIAIHSSIIDKQITSWYENTDISDEEMLAAAVICFGSYSPQITYKEIEQARDFCFPHQSFEISVEELKEDFFLYEI